MPKPTKHITNWQFAIIIFESVALFAALLWFTVYILLPILKWANGPLVTRF